MKYNDEKETDIRIRAEKSIEKNIEMNTEKNTDHRKKSHEMDMLNGSLALKMLIFAMPLAASSILQRPDMVRFSSILRKHRTEPERRQPL